MDVAVLIARVLLAVIFGVAGVTKLADLPGSTAGMRKFGLPRPLAVLVGMGLPIAELTIAVVLLTSTWAWRGALGAIVLALAFIAGIAVNLAWRRTPSARFPGHPRSTPADWLVVARLSALAAGAAFILWQGRDDPGPSMVAWIGDLSVIETAALGTALLALGVAGFAVWMAMLLLRQNGRLMTRINALEAPRRPKAQAAGTAMPSTHTAKVDGSTDSRVPARPVDASEHGTAPGPSRSRVGQPAPAVTLPTISGGRVSLQELHGERTLLLFWNPECGFCKQMLNDLRAWEADPPPGAPRLLVISTGTIEANRKMALRSPVLLDHRFVAGRAFGASGTPSAVLIDAEGRTASEVAVGAQEILELGGARASVNSDGSAPREARASGSTQPA